MRFQGGFVGILPRFKQRAQFHPAATEYLLGHGIALDLVAIVLQRFANIPENIVGIAHLQAGVIILPVVAALFDADPQFFQGFVKVGIAIDKVILQLLLALDDGFNRGVDRRLRDGLHLLQFLNVDPVHLRQG